MSKRLQAATNERGTTMVEVLVALVLVGILLAVAVPSYLGFRDRAANNAAKERLRDALPATETYYADGGTYVGMDEAALVKIDSSISPTLSVVSVTPASFCLADTVGGKTWSVKGPAPSGSDFTVGGDCS
jgi:type IV pilus assembly protein PilA